MLQDLRRAEPVRHSKTISHTLAFSLLYALAVLALLFLMSNKVEILGDPEYPTTFYGP